MKKSLSIIFDHVYCSDPNHAFRAKLGRAGFFMDDLMVEHPGKMYCRFLRMNSKVKKQKYYFEFVDKKSIGPKFVGFSLGSKRKLKLLFKSFKKLSPVYSHKNYNWKENSIDDLPGWNFLTFPKRKSILYVWMTEYERSVARNKRNKLLRNQINPNGVDTIKAFHFELTKKDIDFFTLLLGMPKGNYFRLQGSMRLYFKKAKFSKIKAIIVSTKTFPKIQSKFKFDGTVDVNGNLGLLVKNKDQTQWDIVITAR